MKHTNRGDDSKNGQGNPFRTRPFLVKIIGRESADERAKDKEREYRIAERLARWTKITGIATIVAAFGAVLAAVIFYMQLGTMQAQLTAQEVDFRIDQRPIIVDDDKPDLPPGIKLGANYDEPTQQFWWNYAVRNIGKTTAVGLTLCEYISFFGGHFRTKAGCRDSNDLAPSKGMWASDPAHDNMTKDEVNKTNAGGVIIKIVITYHDTYGTSYDAFLCYRNNPNRTIALYSRHQIDSIPTDDDKQ